MSDGAKKPSNGKTATIVGLIIIIILLWLWLRGPKNVRNNTNKYGDVVLDGPRNSIYQVPGLKTHDIWDWINATDMGYMPMLPPRRAQAMPLSFDPIVLPVMVYVKQPVPDLPTIAQLPPAPEFEFEAWKAPPLPTWWYETGYNTNFTPVTFLMTSDNAVGVLGKNFVLINPVDFSNRKNPLKYPNQYFTDEPSGEIILLGGKRYRRDSTRDNFVSRPAVFQNASR